MQHCKSSLQPTVARASRRLSQSCRPTNTNFTESSPAEDVRCISGSWYDSCWRLALLGSGCLFVLAAIVGVILPGIPTTPFLLLASWCFSRSSRRFEAALKRSPILGPFLDSWQRHRAVTRRTKLVACLSIVVMTSVTVFVVSVAAAVKVVTVVGALCGITLILRLPSMTPTNASR